MKTFIMLVIAGLVCWAMLKRDYVLACFWVLCLIGIKVEQIHNIIEAAHQIKGGA